MRFNSVTKVRLESKQAEIIRDIREETGMTTSEILRKLIDSTRLETIIVNTVKATVFQNDNKPVTASNLAARDDNGSVSSTN